MSIVACVKVYDGIVLGAESMTQLMGRIGPQIGLIKAFSNARKLFQAGSLPVGVLTYGAGNIGTRSIESFVQEFADTLSDKKDWDVDAVGRELLKFISGPYNLQFATVTDKPPIGFYVAGYSKGRHLGSECEFVVPADTDIRKPRLDEKFGASWRGVSIPFTRLYTGVDPRLLNDLANAEVPVEVRQKIEQLLPRYTAPIVFDGMPVQDAIGFCRFILETTIGQATYEAGAASCGGPLQLAVIARSEFTWISQPGYRL